ncbi:hypothetical protein HMPREF1983_00951 [Gemella bergeri ATCC 700627]|uniref:Uncharacterized protein n=1 Tax=Gemella bergeri ATCC 700627 TaxID=1321820 RepID=U2RWA3_9BACL|nr:DUF3310 domain-containing protein [Gemella bergeri]ERK57848.1 hypothetical protein HMPREF1983_00951 [Gemella bergeri ATCC 700627]
MRDNINPDHYRILTKNGEFETIDLIQSIVTDFGSVCQANILKYGIRANKKHDKPTEDIKKIVRYCEFWLNELEGKKASASVVVNSLLGEQEKELVRDKNIKVVRVNSENIPIQVSNDIKNTIDALGKLIYGED